MVLLVGKPNFTLTRSFIFVHSLRLFLSTSSASGFLFATKRAGELLRPVFSQYRIISCRLTGIGYGWRPSQFSKKGLPHRKISSGTPPRAFPSLDWLRSHHRRPVYLPNTFLSHAFSLLQEGQLLNRTQRCFDRRASPEYADHKNLSSVCWSWRRKSLSPASPLKLFLNYRPIARSCGPPASA